MAPLIETRRWRKLPADQLENLILTIRRSAGAGLHLGPQRWAEVDRMRRRLAKLQKEAA
jgi:methylphosphotriester-DNA--protein-cysteine methyltransferase